MGVSVCLPNDDLKAVYCYYANAEIPQPSIKSQAVVKEISVIVERLIGELQKNFKVEVRESECSADYFDNEICWIKDALDAKGWTVVKLSKRIDTGEIDYPSDETVYTLVCKKKTAAKDQA